MSHGNDDAGSVAGKPLLVRVDARHLEDAALLEDLSRWRNAARDSFYRRAPTSSETMRVYLKGVVAAGSTRVLFLVTLPDGRRVGHVAFSEITATSAKFGNVLRGEAAPRGTMVEACKGAIQWAKEKPGVNVLHLDVFTENQPAVRLYTALGFKEVERVWHARQDGPDGVAYVPSHDHAEISPGRWVSFMRLDLGEVPSV